MGYGNGTAWLHWLLAVLNSHCGTYKIWCWPYVFLVTAKAYNASDVFNTQELLNFMSQSDKISGVIVGGDSISNWHDKVSQKYSKLPGIRELHDFLIVSNPTTNNAVVLVREFCHGGPERPNNSITKQWSISRIQLLSRTKWDLPSTREDKSIAIYKAGSLTANVQ